jgi:integrase
VKRQKLTAATGEFIAAEEPRTQSSNGQRAQLSPKYHYNRAIQLRRFAGTFPGYAVCDIGKHDLDSFFASKLVSKFSSKSRNHHRAALAQFFSWCVRKDYLAVGHRLNEADAMRAEHANTAEVEFYTPNEFRALLEAADGSLQAMIAIGGLAGLRTAELLRLDWADVWRVRGHIEVTAGKSKTRQRRLVEICPALAAWLGQFRTFTTGKLCTLHEITFQQHFVELWKDAKITRKPNGLRHASCTYHFALHDNENLTAQQAGNSPAMIHAHYKGLATKKEAETWFAIKPAKTAKNIIRLADGVRV